MALALVAPALIAAAAASPHWPQFRGPGAAGVADGASLLEAGSAPEAPQRADLRGEGRRAGRHHAPGRRHQRAGSYMPTPLIYHGHLYVLKNQGILSCYDLRSGDQKYEPGP